MSAKEEFVELLQERPGPGDVIFLLQGDGVYRAPYAAQLFMQDLAPLIAIVGSADDRSYGSFPSVEVRDALLGFGVPDEAILCEAVAPHTRAEADRAMQLASEFGWRCILIVTSPHHQYRAFLTFLQAMHDARLDLRLVNAVAPLPLTEHTPWGRRGDLMRGEFDKIVEYQLKGDVASFEDGVSYLKASV